MLQWLAATPDSLSLNCNPSTSKTGQFTSQLAEYSRNSSVLCINKADVKNRLPKVGVAALVITP